MDAGRRGGTGPTPGSRFDPWAPRSPSVRALGLAVGDEVQVSMNLIDPAVTGPAAVTDAIAAQARVSRCELVGLAPRAVLDAIDADRWAELDLAEDRTIEARLAARPGTGT